MRDIAVVTMLYATTKICVQNVNAHGWIQFRVRAFLHETLHISVQVCVSITCASIEGILEVG